jgi:hypothetical protein
MSKYCPKCDVEFDENLSNCPECGGYITFDGKYIEPDLLEPTEINHDSDQSVEENTTPVFNLDQNSQKLLGLSRLSYFPRVLLVMTALCFTSPGAIVLAIYSIVNCIKLLLHYKEYEPLKDILIISNQPSLFKTRKQILQQLVFNIILLFAACLMFYYIFIWLKQNKVK